MSEVPKRLPMASDEHRRRRRAAYERAAAAHQQAAIVHEEAAAFFELHGKIEKAAYHRIAAGVEHQRAQQDQDAADSQ